MRRILLMLCGLLLVTGCSLFGGDDDDNAKAEAPSTMTFSLATTNDVNSTGNNGRGAPIQIKVFELEDDSMLKAADYEELSTDYKDALQSNYVNDYDYVLAPGSFKYIAPMQLDEDTRYIGVMAKYADPNSTQWKKVIKVKPRGHEYHLLVLMQAKEVILQEGE